MHICQMTTLYLLSLLVVLNKSYNKLNLYNEEQVRQKLTITFLQQLVNIQTLKNI